ncbi:MAG: NAD(P)/FAD-dependent oxidoreductase [Bacteroidales bacterium]
MNKTGDQYTLNVPETGKKRIVVIGGGFGGLSFLKKLRSKAFQVVLLDRYNYHTFQPLLYQVATAGLEPDSIAGPLRKIIRNRKDWHFRMLRVNRIDIEKNKVFTTAGVLAYDYLIIATGSKINYFGNDSIAINAYPVKQVTHALDLRHTLFQQFEGLEILDRNSGVQENFNFVVVGAGPTGVEICGALAELKKHVLPKDYPELDISRMHIFLVEGLSKVLPTMSDSSGKKAKKYLEQAGVKVILNCMTDSFDGKTVHLNNGEKIVTNTLIWAAGVKPNLPEGIPGDFMEKDSLRVNVFNQLYNKDNTKIIDNVFAIGDIAFMKTEKYENGLPGLAPVAIQQGKHLATNMKRMLHGKAFNSFKYVNRGVMATIGRNRAVADLPCKINLSGTVGWMLWMMVHLLYLIEFRNKILVFINWFWNYVTYDRGIRLIIRPSPKSKDRISREMFKAMRNDE